MTVTHTAPCPHLYVMCMYVCAHTVPTVTGENNAYSVPKFKHTHTHMILVKVKRAVSWMLAPSGEQLHYALLGKILFFCPVLCHTGRCSQAVDQSPFQPEPLINHSCSFDFAELVVAWWKEWLGFTFQGKYLSWVVMACAFTLSLIVRWVVFPTAC